LKDVTETFQAISAQIAALDKIRGKNVRDRIEQIDKDLQNHEVELTKIENDVVLLSQKVTYEGI